MSTRPTHGEVVPPSDLRSVVVVGAHNSARTSRPNEPVRAWAAMEYYTRRIQSCSLLRVARLPLVDCAPSDIVDRVCGVGSNVAAAVVVGLSPAGEVATADGVGECGGPTVVTEIDLVTVALAASVVSTLANRGISPRDGRVVIACPERAPLLGPVLIECGIGSITRWNSRDVQDFSLMRLLSHNDVLIDLSARDRVGDEYGLTIDSSSDPCAGAALALPGLSDALCRRAFPQIDAPVLAACARALVFLTERGHVLPDLGAPLLTSTVARYADQAFDLAEKSRLQHCR